MPRVKLWQHSQTPLEEPSLDPADVLACFRRIKEGPTLGELKQDLREKQKRLEQYDRAGERLSGDLIASKSQSDFTKLEQHQKHVNSLKLEMVEVSDQIANHKVEKDSSATELQAIIDLPRVLGVRAETPDTIVVTVVASIVYDVREYLLGTWDIYFGKLEGLMRDGKTLALGKGDRSHYRVRRVDDRRVDPPGIDYYNYEDGSFCFGDNYDAVNGLAKSKEYLHTVQVMLAYLSWIGNGSNRTNIPNKFRPLERKDLQR